MVRANLLTLVSKHYGSDSVGNQIPVETIRTVYCSAVSVSQSEFFRGGEQGLQPSHKFILFRYDYSGEDEVEFEGHRYTVYRTYADESDNIELYVQRRVGS